MSEKANTNWDNAAREFIRADIKRRFDGVAEKAAAAYGITGANLSNFLSAKNGIGPKIMYGVCKSAGIKLGQLIGEELVLADEDPYPNRTASINFLRNEISEYTIYRVLGQAVTGPDRSKSYWVARIAQIEEMVRDEIAKDAEVAKSGPVKQK